MTKKTIIAGLQAEQLALNKYVKKLEDDFSHKSLRKLRVALKQHKTFLHFINFIHQEEIAEKSTASIDQEPLLTIPKPVKKLYKKSGKTRKWYVCKKKVDKLLEDGSKKYIKSFEKYCKSKSKKQRKKFYKRLEDLTKDFPYENLFDKIIHYFTTNSLQTAKKKYRLYKQAVLENIVELLEADTVDTDVLHDIRKEIKHLLYFGKLFDDDSGPTLKAVGSDNPVDTYKHFSKTIGRMNDKVDLRKALKKYKKSKDGKKKRHWAEEARDEIKKTLQKEKQNIIHELNETFIK